MMNDLNNVKMKMASNRPYHHGDLRVALIDAAENVLAEKGVSGFSLREAARRAGVSPAAPSHHFRDARGLLTAVATRGFALLTAELQAAVCTTGEKDALEAVGAAYINFARARPAIFSMMWASHMLQADDPDYLAAGRKAFNAFECVASGLAVPVRDEPHIPDPDLLAAWAMVHGYARLILDGALTGVPDAMQAEVLKRLPSTRAVRS